MDPARHQGRVVLITGAGSGIGAAAALRIAREGGTVVGCDLNEAALQSSLDSIHEAGGQATMVTANVTNQADVDRLVRETIALHGRIDALANVAGIMDWFLPAHEVDDETWNRVMAVNVTGPMMLCRAVLPGMMERQQGAIVNIASVGGLGGGSAGAAYTVSKHAIIGLNQSIAWSYRKLNIRANVICPGGVETNIGTTAAPRSQWGLEQLTPWHMLASRQAKPEEIATLISWLLSEEASNVSGAVITADGAWSSA